MGPAIHVNQPGQVVADVIEDRDGFWPLNDGVVAVLALENGADWQAAQLGPVDHVVLDLFFSPIGGPRQGFRVAWIHQLQIQPKTLEIRLAGGKTRRAPLRGYKLVASDVVLSAFPKRG